MKLSKKGKKGVRIKKLANGGNGDPVKEASVADKDIRVNAFGESYEYNENLPAGGDPNFGYARQLNESERISMDLYGFPGGGSNIKSDPISQLGIFGFGPQAAYNTLVSLGEIAYSNLAGPLSSLISAPVTIGGTPLLGGAVTGEGLVNSYFAAHGSTNLPQDIKDFYNDPSWANAGQVAFDIFETLPVAIDYFLPSVKPAIEGYSKVKNTGKETPMTFAISSGDATGSVARAAEAKGAINTYLSRQIQTVQNAEKAGIYTEEQAQEMIAKILAFNEEKFKSPVFLEKLIEAQKSAYTAAETDAFGIRTASANLERARLAGIRNADVSTFGYIEYADDGAATYELFATPEQAGLEMLNAIKQGDEVLRNAVLRTRAELQGYLGLYTEGATSSYGYKVDEAGNLILDTFGRKIIVEDAKATYAAEMGRAFEGAEMSLALDPASSTDKLLYTIGHEADHLFQIPFFKYTLNNYAIGKYTNIDDIVQPYAISTEGNRVALKISDATQVKSGSYLDRYLSRNEAGLRRDFERQGLQGVDLEEALLAERAKDLNDIVYLSEPAEVTARLTEMKIAWWESQGVKGGQPMNEWLYNFTPEKANQALDLFEANGGDRKFIMVLKGNTEKERLESLTGLLNGVLTPSVPILLGGAATATEANITTEETPTVNKRGGFISRKKRRKGYRSI